MTSHCRGKGRSLFYILPDLTEHLLKELVVLLLSQDLEALDQGETRIDHHGKLAREDGEVFRLDLFRAAELGDADLATLFFHRCDRYLLSFEQLAQRFAAFSVSLACDKLVQ